MENLRDIVHTITQDNYINENSNVYINENINKEILYIKGSEEKNKSIDINLEKNRGYLNIPNELAESKEYNINIVILLEKMLLMKKKL